VDLKRLRFFSVPHDGGSPLVSPVDQQLVLAQRRVRERGGGGEGDRRVPLVSPVDQQLVLAQRRVREGGGEGDRTVPLVSPVDQQLVLAQRRVRERERRVSWRKKGGDGAKEVEREGDKR
jgi:hypothetical protein